MEKFKKELLYSEIGSKIKEHLERASLKQVDLVKNLDISKGSLANIIAGRQQASIHILYEIAEELHLNVHDLLPEKDFFKIKERAKSEKISDILKSKNVEGESLEQILHLIKEQK